MLLELTNDYIRFSNTSTLKMKKLFLKDMNHAVKDFTKSDSVTKKAIKTIYQDIYAGQLQQFRQIGNDEKNQEKLKKAKK